MKNKFLFLMFFIVSQTINAQSGKESVGRDNLTSVLGQVISGYDLVYNYNGNIYFMISEFQNGKLKDAYILHPNKASSDTIKIRLDDFKKLHSELRELVKEQTVKIVAPFIYLEDPKKGPNKNVMIYDETLNSLFSSLHNITKQQAKNIILPLNVNVKTNISVN